MAFPFDGSTVALWKLDETAGGSYSTLVDAAAFGGTQRDLTEVVATTPGYSNQWSAIVNGHNGAGSFARRFPGLAATPYFTRATDATISAAFVGSWTFEAWIRMEDLAFNYVPFAHVGGTTNETAAHNYLAQIVIQTTGRLQVFWEQGAGGNVSFSGTVGTQMVAGTWYHIAIVVDNSGASSIVKLFINGVLQQTSGALTKATGGTSGSLFLGGDSNSGFRGTLDDVHISNIARADAVIAADAAASQHTADANSLLLWRLNEAPDCKEESAYGYHLRRVNGVFEAVDPLVSGSTKARKFTATEYDGHDGYEALRSTFAGNWTFEAWMVLSSLHQTADRGICVYGDPSLTDALANNVWAIDLLSEFEGVVGIEGGVLRVVQERATGVREDTTFTISSELMPDGEEYDRHYLAVVHYIDAGIHHFEIWIDGALRWTGAKSQGFEGGTAGYFRLGSSSEAGFHPYHGVLDDVRISNARRLQAEIEATWAGRGAYVEQVPTFPVAWPMDADTIAFFKFNEPTTPASAYGQTNDSAPGARHMLEVNNPGAISHQLHHVVNGPNQQGYARRFSGTGTCHLRRAADAGGVTLFTGSYTIEAWVRPDALAGAIFSYAGAGGNETAAENFLTQLGVTGAGKLQSFWEQGAGGDVTGTQVAGGALVVGTWTHVAMTVDYSGGTATVKFYLDGVLADTVAGLTKATGGTNATYNIAGQGTAGGATFPGSIKSVRLSSKVRLLAEVAASAAAVDKQHVLDGDTFALWQLNDPPDARDETAYGYHLRKVTGAVGIAPPLVIDGGQSRFMETATEYAAHAGYEPMRDMFANRDWTFDCWFKMSVGYAGVQRGLWVHGDPGPEDSGNNFVSVDLQADRSLFVLQERGAGVNDASNQAGTPRAILGTVEAGYVRHYLVVLRYFSGGVWNWEVWLDAVLLYTFTLPLGYDGGTTSWLRISSGNTLGSNTFFGTMDNARWTKRRATAAEIAGAYLDGINEAANCLVVTPVSPLPVDDPDFENPLNTWLVFDVTDPRAMGAVGGSNKPVEVRAIFGLGGEVLVWDGTTFHADYVGSHRDELMGGHRYYLRPTTGTWSPDAVTVRVKEL